MKASWNGKLIAESSETINIEGNHYFPEFDVKKELLISSELKSFCPWKGEASYYHIKIDENINENAAWYYREPKDAAKVIKGRIAFWKGVKIEE